MASTPPPTIATDPQTTKRKRGRPPLSPSQRKPKPVPSGRPRGRPKGSGVKSAANKTGAGVKKTAAADPTTPLRRGRGRPRKDASVKVEKLMDAAVAGAAGDGGEAATPAGQVKRGRGRPKGSGKKAVTEKETPAKRKGPTTPARGGPGRGRRSAGSAAKAEEEDNDEEDGEGEEGVDEGDVDAEEQEDEEEEED
ncbi:hypothetical protein C8A01DRAFT_34181 [Parachaetomium inaequale]|uniref:Uncharacterized protein n=1 Tax=Parachaetomium inaequale TaxID=2588326 RepID=A0AAN6PMF7_9PEZI|nr:hypothetical protein C8A01DRAFT_34181 [Parachaetomium inaequale]